MSVSSSARDRVLRASKANPEAPVARIAEIARCHPSTVRRYLRRGRRYHIIRSAVPSLLRKRDRQIRTEPELRAELNTHLSNLDSDAAAAHEAIERFDDATYQPDWRTTGSNGFAVAERRVLVIEAQERTAAAAAATARAQSIDDLLGPGERLDALTELIEELDLATC